MGKRVRIILIGNHYYSGIVLSEDDSFITIRDKFSKQVSIQKNRIETLEVSDGE